MYADVVMRIARVKPNILDVAVTDAPDKNHKIGINELSERFGTLNDTQLRIMLLKFLATSKIAYTPVTL